MSNYHEYFKFKKGYVIGGEWFPRVTAIVDIKSKPALYKYYGNLNSFEEGESIKTKSASEGTQIHEAVEKILKGETAVVDETIKPAVDAFEQFIQKTGIKTSPEFIEQKVVSRKYRYAGTVDAFARIDGKFGVLDIKTSKAIYRDYGLQTSAYFGAAAEYGTLPVETRWILRIDQSQKCLNCGASSRTKGGKEKITGGDADCKHKWGPVRGEIELKELANVESDYEAFVAAKKLWEWENEDLLKKIGYF